MSNNRNRNSDAKIARAYVAARNGVERTRITDGEVHAYGQLPNSARVGWYLAGYADQLAAQACAEYMGEHDRR